MHKTNSCSIYLWLCRETCVDIIRFNRKIYSQCSRDIQNKLTKDIDDKEIKLNNFFIIYD